MFSLMMMIYLCTGMLAYSEDKTETKNVSHTDRGELVVIPSDTLRLEGCSNHSQALNTIVSSRSSLKKCFTKIPDEKRAARIPLVLRWVITKQGTVASSSAALKSNISIDSSIITDALLCTEDVVKSWRFSKQATDCRGTIDIHIRLYGGAKPQPWGLDAFVIMDENLQNSQKNRLDVVMSLGSITGGLKPAEVELVLRENMAQVRACWKRHTAISSVSGKNYRIETVFLVGKNGRGYTGTITKSDAPNEEVNLCIKNLPKRWKFPLPPLQEETSVKVTYDLKSNSP